MSSLLDRISEIEQQLASLRAKVEKKKKENKSLNKRWRGKDGDRYWFVKSDGKPNWVYEYNKDEYDKNTDNFHYDTHNYFQTEDKAQKYANVLETERQLKKFADEHNDKIDWSNINQEKWCLYYNCKYYKVDITNLCWSRDARIIYFSSEEIAEQAIDTIGTDKIKEYLTYEW